MTNRDAIVVQAPVHEVLLLEDRARVSRRGVATLKAGRQRALVEGIAPVVIDKTLVVSAGGPSSGVQVIDARVVRDVVPHDEQPAELADLLSERDRTSARIRELREEISRGQRGLRGLTDTLQLGVAELAEDAGWGRPGASENISELAEIREEVLIAIDAQLPITKELDESQRHLAQLERTIADLSTPRMERRAVVEVDLDLAVPSEVRLELDYSVPGACWRPAHRANLVRDEGGDRVQFATDACVWQNTGEDWEDVELRFSTERSSLGTSPPELESDVLRVQRKAAVLEVEAREEVAAELSAPTGGQRDAVPGIDDGGAALVISAPARTRVPSNGRPHRVFLSEFESSAEVDLVAIPELSPCVLRRARLENRGERAILAGPVELAVDGGPVGQSKVLFVAPGEGLELGYGPLSDLRLHREVEASSESSRVLSSWRSKEHTITVRLSNLGDSSHQLSITERVPVSEIDKVKIEVDAGRTSDRATADEQGFVRWSLTIGPKERLARTLAYRVKTHEDVRQA